jgi:hypothetical protein
MQNKDFKIRRHPCQMTFPNQAYKTSLHFYSVPLLIIFSFSLEIPSQHYQFYKLFTYV